MMTLMMTMTMMLTLMLMLTRTMVCLTLHLTLAVACKTSHFRPRQVEIRVAAVRSEEKESESAMRHALKAPVDRTMVLVAGSPAIVQGRQAGPCMEYETRREDVSRGVIVTDRKTEEAETCGSGVRKPRTSISMSASSSSSPSASATRSTPFRPSPSLEDAVRVPWGTRCTTVELETDDLDDVRRGAAATMRGPQ